MATPGKELKDESLEEVGEAQEYNVITDIERRKIGMMRAFVEKEDPSAKEVDDYMLRRFLRARDLDIEKASKMFLKYLSWKNSFLPDGSITLAAISNELSHNKVFVQGVDKKGQLILVVLLSRHYPSKSNFEEFKRFVVFTLETVCSRMPPGKEKFLAIADLEGWGYANSDIRGYVAALSTLQDSYPERLGNLYFIHVPYLFMTAWKIVYPFIDSNTKKKIDFVENKKLEATLLSEIDVSQLPDIYGGQLPLVPIQNL